MSARVQHIFKELNTTTCFPVSLVVMTGNWIYEK